MYDLKLIAILIAILAAQSPASANESSDELAVTTGGYTAIALDPESNFYGVVNDASTAAEARALAIRNCGKPGCAILDESLEDDVKVFVKDVVYGLDAYQGFTPATEFKRYICKNGLHEVLRPDYSKSDFVAIALSESTLTTTSSDGGASRFDAEAAALNDCRTKSQAADCRIIASARGQYLGFALIERNGLFTKNQGKLQMKLSISPDNLSNISFRGKVLHSIANTHANPKVSGLPFSLNGHEWCK